ncbi:MAG: hypothetical protein KDD66_18660, partial [Bdellovibrionales bacterium]|nr:hypothetical protein [Bdellovibrionales bacterium]
YGSYVLSDSGGPTENALRCSTAFYRKSAPGAAKVIEYGFVLPVRNDSTGVTAGVANSMNPDPNAPATWNYLSIANTGSSAFSAVVHVYEEDGTARPERNFLVTNLQPGRRYDYPLAHPYGKTINLYRIVPSNLTAPYQAFLSRYSQRVGGDYRFAFAMRSDPGSCDSGLVSLSTMDPATNWAVVANPTDHAINYTFEVRKIFGSVLHSATTGIAPYSQHHININQYIGQSALGTLRIKCAGTPDPDDALLVHSVMYGHLTGGTPEVEWAYGTQPGPELDDGSYKLVGSVNTFWQAANWHKTFNGTASTQNGTVTVYAQNGCAAAQRSVGVQSGGTRDHGLHENLGQNVVGLSLLSLPSASGRISAEVLRVYPHDQGGIGYIMNLPTAVVDSSGTSGSCGGPASSVTSVTKHGVTWTFDRPHVVGQYANGDYWVAVDPSTGTVRITSITPDFDGTHNGWEVNPYDVENQGFDVRISSFDAGKVPALPYSAGPNQSIVKGVSVDYGDTGCRPCLQKAAVLTVVSEAPPGNGATFFRPPYFGSNKLQFSTTGLRTDLLPSLAPPANTPTLESVRARFGEVQLDHKANWTGRHLHPVDNMPDYGADIARDTAVAALRLMLNDSIQDKMPALIAYVQYGIDLYNMRFGGLLFSANGGHTNGRKLPLAFAAVMLNNQPMKDALFAANTGEFSEDGMLYRSAVNGMVLFGQTCSESMYWYNQLTTGGSRTCRDPYQYIDGGETPGGSYQFCCNSQVWKGAALALHLMPELYTLWNNDNMNEYVDRWVTFGAWTQPDPYAPNGEGALDNDPSNGIGRYP